MIVNMITIASRRTNYLDRTLDSFFASDGKDLRLNIIVGSSDTSHVEKYRNMANIVPWDEASESQSKPGNKHLGCTLNTLRALRYGTDDYCLTCEDDILFSKDWFGQLMATIAEIERPQYILNLGQGGDQPVTGRYWEHSNSYLCGSQGIFYPSKPLRQRVAEFVRYNINGGTVDNLVGQYGKRYAALYNTYPMLVSHIGQVSVR